MFPSVEVRWFFEGPAPEHAQAWFRAVAGAPGVERRADRYVRPPSADGLGVKWREGKLEVKRLMEVLGEERFHIYVAGRVERWRKWSFPLTPEAELPEDDWVEVVKRRQVRYFAVGADGIRRLEPGERAAQACGLELGEVRVGEAVWWSVCLESFGADEAVLPDRLRQVGAHVVAVAEPPPLDAARAMSYPAWLMQVGA